MRMMTKQIFLRINYGSISLQLHRLFGLRDKLGGMDKTEFEPSKLGTRAQYVRQFTFKKPGIHIAQLGRRLREGGREF